MKLFKRRIEVGFDVPEGTGDHSPPDGSGKLFRPSLVEVEVWGSGDQQSQAQVFGFNLRKGGMPYASGRTAYVLRAADWPPYVAQAIKEATGIWIWAFGGATTATPASLHSTVDGE